VTTVLDAFAIIAALAGEPAAAEVEAELRRKDADARVAAINLAEVVDQLIRQAGYSEEAVDVSLESLMAGGLAVVPMDGSLGRLAGRLRARHYDKRTTALSMADCVALATSVTLRATLATADPSLAAAARTEGVTVLGLPDSNGKRP